MKNRVGFLHKYIIIIIAFVLVLLFLFCAILFEQKVSSPNISVQNPDSNFQLLKVCVSKESLMLSCFHAEDNIWYAFLPSFCDNKLSDEIWLSFESQDKSLKMKYEFSQSAEKYTEYRISFFDKKNEDNIVEDGLLRVIHSSNLPSIYINTESGNLDLYQGDKEHIETINVTILDSDGTFVLSDNKGMMSGHGNRSYSRPKKPFTITLSKDISLLGMHSSDKWILVSNVCDPTGIQNAITYDMARDAGMPYVSEFQYVDVYMNSLYHGTYLLTEKIDITEDKMNFNNLNRLNKELNPELLTNPDSIWVKHATIKYYNLPNNPNDISGGYLLERDYGGKFSEEKVGFTTEYLNDQYVIKSPSNVSAEQIAYIKNQFDEFEDALLNKEGDWTKYIDASSFVDKYIIDEFTQNQGGGATSAYYYKPQDSISKLIYAGPVWDYDTAYATYGASNRLCYSQLQPSCPTKLYYLLYQDETFRRMVKDRYLSYYRNYVTGALLNNIDHYSTLCADSFCMNEIRWSELNFDYQKAIEDVRKYIYDRQTFLDKVWIENEELITIHFKDGAVEWNSSVLPGDLLNPPKRVVTGYWINCETEEYYDPSKPVTQEEEYYFSIAE